MEVVLIEVILTDMQPQNDFIIGEGMLAKSFVVVKIKIQGFAKEVLKKSVTDNSTEFSSMDFTRQ